MRVRRALLSGVLLVTVVVPTTATTAHGSAAPAAAPVPAVTVPEASGDLRRVDLLADAAGTADPDGARALARASAVPDVLARTLPTDGAVVVGLTWTAATERQPTATIRFRTSEGWGGWEPVDMGAEGEGGSPEGTAAASDGMVAVGADTVEVRISGTAEAPLTTAEIVLVDEEARPADAVVAAAVPGQVTTAAATTTGEGPATGTAVAAAVDYSRAPDFISRARWGADETIPYVDCAVPAYADTLDRFVVHHTAGTNAYSPADSPAILRGIQRYHVEGRGWCDVGYNALVDKYGQVFEGRRGGLERLVVGVHASGHNTGTVGVSVLGNFVAQAPTEEAISALVHVIGWKSYIHGLDPAGSSTKNGVLLAHVIGHNQVAATSCPGSISNRLHEIGVRARDVMLGYQPSFASVGTADGALLRDGAVVSAFVPTRSDVTVTVRTPGGAVVATSERATDRGWFVHRWNGRIGESDAFVEPGTYAVRVDGESTAGKAFSTSASVAVAYPPGMVATPVSRLVELPGGGAQRVVDLDDGPVDLPAGTSALLLRACAPSSSGVTLVAGVGDGVTVEPSDAPGDCALVLVPTDGESLRVSTDAGAAAVRVDLVGAFTPARPVAGFTDVPPGHEFHADVQWLFGSGITNGNPDGSYGAASPISRSAMAAFLYRLAGWPSTAPPPHRTFVDVAPGAQFHTEIEWLAEEGISTGTSWGLGRYLYLPASPVSRQAMAAFLFRMCGEPETDGTSPFPDVPQGGPFTEAILWLADNEITTGYDDGTFRPQDPVTRQAMAAFLHRYADVRASGAASCE